MSLELAPILNPMEVQQITQVEIDPFVPLSMNEQEQEGMPSFSIPTDLDDGFYLVQFSTYFPDQTVNAIYTNTLCIGDCGSTLRDIVPAEEFPSPSFNNTYESDSTDSFFGSGDVSSGLNLTTMR